jgi:elongation factor 1-gamma
LYFSWRKLDPVSDECKQLVTQYFKWEGTDAQGRKFNQGKILK